MAGRRGRWGWWVGGAAAAVAAGGGALLVMHNRGAGSVGTGGPAPASGVPALLSVGSLSGTPGAVLSATLTFGTPRASQSGGTATYLATDAQSVSLSVVLTDGSANATLSATVSVPAIAAGETALVPMHTTQAIPSTMTSSPIGVAVTASGGATVTGSLPVSASAPAAASFEFTETTLGTSDSTPGGVVVASVTVKNTGGTAATPGFSGGLTVSGSQVAAWQLESSAPSVAAGAEQPVGLKLILPSSLAAGTDPVSLTVTP